MTIREKKDADFSVEVIRVLKSERVDNRNRIDFRIVKWKKAHKATLEKRRIWEKDGVERPSKTVGLTVDDVKFIFENYKEIVNLL